MTKKKEKKRKVKGWGGNDERKIKYFTSNQQHFLALPKDSGSTCKCFFFSFSNFPNFLSSIIKVDLNFHRVAFRTIVTF